MQTSRRPQSELMPFNTRDPRWLAMRSQRITSRYMKGAYDCPCCGNRMWFRELETVADFKEGGGDVAAKRVATLDHLWPRYLGGLFWHANTYVMCITCNQEKGSQQPYVWLANLLRRGSVSRVDARQIATRIKRAEKRQLKFWKGKPYVEGRPKGHLSRKAHDKD